VINKIFERKKQEQKDTVDPTVFHGHERDDNGVIISAINPLDTVDKKLLEDTGPLTPIDGDERREKKERRQGPKNRRAHEERRQNFKACLRKLLPFFNRRSNIERRKDVPVDRRYGLDRRIISQLSVDELKRLEGSLPMNITDAFEKPSEKIPSSEPKKEDTMAIHSGISRAPVYDRGGYFIAETFRKDPLFQDGGNNFVEFCNIPNSEMLLTFDETTLDGMVSCNQGDLCPLGLTKASSEVIHFVIHNEITIEISDKFHRQIKLIKKTSSDPTEQFVGLASKNDEKYFPVALHIRNIGSNIQRISDNKVRFGNITIMYDGSQIIDVLDTDNNVFRLTGIAGLSNLEQYIQTIAAKEEAAKEEEAKLAAEEKEDVLETTIASQTPPKPEPLHAPETIISLDVFGSAEKKRVVVPSQAPVLQEPDPSPAPKEKAPEPMTPTQKPPSKPEFEAPMFQTSDDKTN
jgi:hypothetical protein